MHNRDHVLIVEDDEILSMLYSQVLADKNIVVEVATSLAQAEVMLAKTTTLDAIILDNQLGDGYGLSLIPLIKQKFDRCSILMISANVDGDFFVEAFAVGIDDYLTKPVNLDLLWLKLQKTIKNKKLLNVSERQAKQLAQWVSQEQVDQELARFVFESLCSRLSEPYDFLQTFSKASATFSGDLLLHQFGQDGSLYLLLADSMGHGLAAAIALLPVMEVFQAMTHKALPLAHLVYELNEKLLHQLPDDRFVAAVLLRFDTSGNSVEIWNGGMPAILIFDKDEQLVVAAESRNMALGILDGTLLDLATQKFALTADMQLVGYTDGLLDNVGKDGLQLQASSLVDLWTVNQRFEGVRQFMQNVDKPNDDMTTFMISITKLRAYFDGFASVDLIESDGAIRFEVVGHALMQLDLNHQVIRVLQNCAVPQSLCNKTFAVLTELFLNSLEHGVLGLSSSLKLQEDGFLQYYTEKDLRCAKMSDADYIHFSVQWRRENSAICIWMRDSGPGFDWTCNRSTDLGSVAGRGLSMIQSLCTTVDYFGNGNEVKVVING